MPVVPYISRNNNHELPIRHRAEKIVDEKYDNMSLTKHELEKEYYLQTGFLRKFYRETESIRKH